MSEMSYSQLREAVAGSRVAIRSRLPLQPAGGSGDKVFPPTYGVAANAPHKYADEPRIIDGVVTRSVLLNSVAAESNAHELALLDALEAGDLVFPNPFVDFTIDAELIELGRLSALEAPHRLADAIFRDSLLDGTLFRLSDIGRAVTDAVPAAATALYRVCPAALVFGMWDSTGPKGGLGSKFQRSFSAEIVGRDVEIGKKVGSRIDPLQIEKAAGPVLQHRDPRQGWTLDEAEAVMEKGKPKEFGEKGERGRPSMINHGNVAPSIDATAGGVTISEAMHVAVLSLAGLRKLRFVTDTSGAVLPADRRRDAEVAARTALAALGLAAMAYRYEADFDLRSRCLLVPSSPPAIELLGRDGSAAESFGLTSPGAAAILEEAQQAAANVGMGWSTDEIRLEPAPKLRSLIKRSREISAANPDEEG